MSTSLYLPVCPAEPPIFESEVFNRLLGLGC